MIFRQIKKRSTCYIRLHVEEAIENLKIVGTRKATHVFADSQRAKQSVASNDYEMICSSRDISTSHAVHAHHQSISERMIKSEEESKRAPFPARGARGSIVQVTLPEAIDINSKLHASSLLFHHSNQAMTRNSPMSA